MFSEFSIVILIILELLWGIAGQTLILIDSLDGSILLMKVMTAWWRKLPVTIPSLFTFTKGFMI